MQVPCGKLLKLYMHIGDYQVEIVSSEGSDKQDLW